MTAAHAADWRTSARWSAYRSRSAGLLDPSRKTGAPRGSVRYSVVVAVDVPDVASAASAASTPITIVIGTVHERNRQYASTGPIEEDSLGVALMFGPVGCS